MKRAVAILLLLVLISSAFCLHAFSADDDFEKVLATFPDSYKASLTLLHKNHPNWRFEKVSVGKNFSECLNAEHDCKSKMNLVEVDSAKDPKACQSDCKNAQYHTLVDGVYRCASYDYIAECMDPTTSLRDNLIFQFEYLGAKAYYTQEKLESVLESAYSFMHLKTYRTSSKTYYYSKIILDTCKDNDVDALFIISRITNEVGAMYPAKLATGYAYEYEKGKTKTVYNFFNIGGNVAASAKYAYNHEWFNPKAALEGGIKFIAQNYVKAGQYTNYFQKFQVNPDCVYGFYWHQYMQGTDAVMHESGYTYNHYCNLNILDKVHVFKIPVYKNLSKVNYEAQDVSFKNASPGEDYGFVNAQVSSTLKVRAQPSTSAIINCSINRSVLLKLTGRSGVWYKVEVLTGASKGKKGYCHGDYVTPVPQLSVAKKGTLTIKPKLRVSTCSYAPALSFVQDAVTIDKNGVASGKKIGSVIFKATSSSGQVGFLEMACVGTIDAPVFTLKGGNKKVTITWKAVEDAVSYRVALYNPEKGNYTLLAKTKALSFTHKSLEEGTEYTYLVRSVDAQGGRSLYSLADNQKTSTLCSAPTAKIVPGSTAVKLTWRKVKGAEKYGIWRYNTAKKTYKKLVETEKSAYTVNGLNPNATYSFVVRARNASGWSILEESGIKQVKTAPAAPIVSANGGQNKITLTWNKCTGASVYRVYRYSSTKKTYTKVAETTALSRTFTNLANGTRYTYLVRAFNKAGVGSSYGESDLVKVITRSASPVVEANAGSTSITLTWKKVKGAAEYGIWQYNSSTKKFVKRGTTEQNTFTLEGLNANSDYVFFVKSRNASGWSTLAASDYTEVLTAPAKPAPTAEQTDRGVALSWKAVAGAVKYYVYSYNSESGEMLKLATMKKTAYTAAKSAENCGFIVRAVNASGGMSDYSQEDAVFVQS